MAEQIPYAVAASLIDRLGSAALREFGRIYGVMDELERLKNTVESIRAVLLDAEDKQEEQNHAVQNWVRRLKEVFFPADDLLDEFLIQDTIHKRDESHQNKLTKVLHSFSPNNIALRRDMAHEIEKIQKKFNDVVKDMFGLNLNPNVVVVQKTNIERRETSSYVSESDIIGREDDKKKIIRLLRQSNEVQNVSLVAIVGIGGLGKTTLAQLVYSDVEVQNLFEKSMWVCVSHNFNVKTIVKNMLMSLTKNKIDDTLSLDNLQIMLRNNLTGNRYLLVLDDVWNESYEKWAQLRTYLMCGAQGSKVVVTTRSTMVVQTMGVSVPYVLNGLLPEESCNLLKKIAFWDDTIGLNQTFESIGKKIAEKCKGVPLAIRSLGGILQSKSEEKEWIDVLGGDFWKLCEDKDSILPVLKLSYLNLSPQQRQCFAYCSLYPKGWKFNTDELIQMWMAQSYLDCSIEGQCMEDVGNQFIKIFLMKSFFQDAKINPDGFQYLPPLERLPFLKSLEILVFDDLEYIYYEDPILHETFFPSLKRLHIWECRKLVGWRRMGDAFNDINTSHHLLLPQFPCLSFLEISRCPMLTHMPTFPNIKSLSLSGYIAEILEATLSIAASQHSIGCTPLSMLKSLRIHETIMDVKNVPQDWWQNLTSLNNLEFNYLSSQHFQVIEFKDGINYLPSLQKIAFKVCIDLKALPDWICNISSLQHIKIVYCTNLSLLPERMPHLTNLRTLEIIDSPLLVEECRTETSATWPKIAHIPNVIIKSDRD
ncbi:CC-NBS-LRR resistance protein [Trifolium medium]|uniref:CC-NBS-LRR resistance protein n=1 Tax=Trifolium medium TaxID=97028 RepID=A0A392LX02_9FABA|nr:CC-NBS-LRR resistance protein [Trifolium medium]